MNNKSEKLLKILNNPEQDEFNIFKDIKELTGIEPETRFLEISENPEIYDTKPYRIKDVNSKLICFLRESVYKGQNEMIVNGWYEKILRFCEINNKKLNEKLKVLVGSDRYKITRELLVSFLIDNYRVKMDYRALNILLKIIPAEKAASFDEIEKYKKSSLNLELLKTRNRILFNNLKNKYNGK